jgi:small subunit ribosomal protein S2
MKESNYENQISKKAITRLERRRRKLEKNLIGIKQMEKLPDAIVVIDPNKEQIAVKEAQKMNIPVVALVDTNCDPEEINYVIPGNDDALRSVRLIVSKLADAVIEGVEMRKQEEEMVARQEAEEAAEDEVEVKVPETPVDKSEDELKPARAYVSEDDDSRDRRGGKTVRRRPKDSEDD